MTLDQLKLFRDIAHARSVSRGAEIGGVSQSAASQHLQEIERLLGVTLLDRSTRPLGLTKAGQMYYEFCRDVLRRKQDFDEALDRLRAGRVRNLDYRRQSRRCGGGSSPVSKSQFAFWLLTINRTSWRPWSCCCIRKGSPSIVCVRRGCCWKRWANATTTCC